MQWFLFIHYIYVTAISTGYLASSSTLISQRLIIVFTQLKVYLCLYLKNNYRKIDEILQILCEICNKLLFTANNKTSKHPNSRDMKSIFDLLCVILDIFKKYDTEYSYKYLLYVYVRHRFSLELSNIHLTLNSD